MSLPILLSSSDPSVRSRAIAMMASILETQPLTILCSFKTYLPFFLDALRNRAEDSVTFSTLNELLVESVLTKSAEVDQESRVVLVEYFSKCIAREVDSGRVNAFVRHMFELSDLPREGRDIDSRGVKSTDSRSKTDANERSNERRNDRYLALTCINRLVGDNLNERYFTALLRVLAHYRSVAICRRLGERGAALINFVVAHPKETVKKLGRCLMCDDLTDPRSELAVEALLRAAKQSPEVQRMLIPLISPLRTHPAFVRKMTFKELRSVVLDSVKQSPPVEERDPAPFESLASVVFADKVFESVDPASAQKWVRGRTPTVVQSELKAGTLPACLDEISKGMGRESPTFAQGKPEVATPAEKTAPAPQQRLTTMASKKKTSGLHLQSRRKFDLYPASRCLMWRAESRDTVKGAILLGPDVKVEKVSPLVVNVKTQEKTHQISFDSETTAEEWFKALLQCTQP